MRNPRNFLTLEGASGEELKEILDLARAYDRAVRVRRPLAGNTPNGGASFTLKLPDES